MISVWVSVGHGAGVLNNMKALHAPRFDVLAQGMQTNRR